MPGPCWTLPVTVPALMTNLSTPAPWSTVPMIVPEFMSMLSVPPPKATLPFSVPVPPAGKVRLLLPARSVRPPGEVPLSQMKVSLPAVGTKVQAARASV